MVSPGWTQVKFSDPSPVPTLHEVDTRQRLTVQLHWIHPLIRTEQNSTYFNLVRSTSSQTCMSPRPPSVSSQLALAAALQTMSGNGEATLGAVPRTIGEVSSMYGMPISGSPGGAGGGDSQASPRGATPPIQDGTEWRHPAIVSAFEVRLVTSERGVRITPVGRFNWDDVAVK